MERLGAPEAGRCLWLCVPPLARVVGVAETTSTDRLTTARFRALATALAVAAVRPRRVTVSLPLIFTMVAPRAEPRDGMSGLVAVHL